MGLREGASILNIKAFLDVPTARRSAHTMPSIADGSVFAARYRIVRCIAYGGMGAVYEVTHLGTDHRRALKVMHPQLLQNGALREQFQREARITALIDSEYIVDVFDAGVDGATQRPFLVMELLRGGDLGKLLRRRGPLAPADVVACLRQAAFALDRTHRAMIVHRDIKPENLYLSYREDGTPRVKVLDFGIARATGEGGPEASALGSFTGTPLYMAPEQFEPSHRISPSIDLYALGMVAYTMLVGWPYWREEAQVRGTLATFVAVASNGPRERASERARRAGVLLPRAFDRWFAQATALSPDARFTSATAQVDSLADALQVPRSPRESLTPSRRRALSAHAKTAGAWMIAAMARARSGRYGRSAALAIGICAVLCLVAWGRAGFHAAPPAGPRGDEALHR